MNKQILSIGTNYLDINFTNFPFEDELVIKPDQEIIGPHYIVEPGGSGINFARFCASLGIGTVFVGKCGNDEMGNLLIKLASVNDIIPAFIQSSEVQTNINANYINDKGRTALTVAGNGNQSMVKEEIMLQVQQHIHEITYLYLGGCFKVKALLEAIPDLISLAHENGVKIVMDHGRIASSVTKEDQEKMHSLIPLVDYYLPSKDEFLQMFPASSIDEAYMSMKHAPTAVVVKDAENGATGYTNNQKIHMNAFKVNVLNTIGAGDSFNAGFIKGLLDGLSFEQAILLGNAVAGLKLSQEKLPSIEEAYRLMEGRRG